jgi:hydroxymethylbilane synthase
LRGNIEARLKKLSKGQADATILSIAGLQRLGVLPQTVNVLDTDTMLPAIGQGAIGLVIKGGDDFAAQLIASINHAPSYACINAERAFLEALNASSRTPVAALGRLASDQVLVLEGLVARPDGTDLLRLQKSGQIEDAEQIGHELGQEIKSRMPADLFKH